jgi:hypothetical protein
MENMTLKEEIMPVLSNHCQSVDDKKHFLTHFMRPVLYDLMEVKDK